MAPHEMKHTNWAENLAYSTSTVHYPETVAQVQETVAQCTKLKALGSRHSFNTIADSTTNQISLKNLNRVVNLNKADHTVTIEGGVRYGEFAPFLQEQGYALPNLASLPHISVAGACATATHGSGAHCGSLATAVSGIEFVNAAGDIVTLTRENNREQFEGAVVNLGAIGVVVRLTLDLQPAFNMKQVVYRNLPMQELEKDFMGIMSSGYSVSLFTTWQHHNINQVWIKSRDDGNPTAAAPAFKGTQPATQNMHPLEAMSAENATEQMGISGVWYERLPHFKMGFQPSAGKELQSEYFVPVAHAYQAMQAIAQLNGQLTPHLYVSEIRIVAADDLWMSPFYRQACVSFHFTWKQNWPAVSRLLPLIEEVLAPYQPLPHWGKLFTMAPAILQSRLPKLPAFRQLVSEHDPLGKFRNSFLEEYIF